MALALVCGDVRLSNSSRPKNTMPEFDAAVKPLMLRPGNATESRTPGIDSAMSLIWRITLVVRSRLAPSGSCAMPIRYCLSCCGTKPGGTRVNMNTVSPSSTA